jgi:apolipoprotein D and lipocalin family protein
MLKKSHIFVFCILLIFTACATTPEKSTESIPLVDEFELNRIEGVWYEIARMPFFISNKLVNTVDIYIFREDGTIEIVYEGYKKTPEGKKKSYTSTAWVPDERTPGLLKVRFSGLLTKDYRIIMRDDDYRWMVVTSDTKKFLWFMSREPEMDEELYRMLVDAARDGGFEVARLQRVPQQWGQQ